MPFGTAFHLRIIFTQINVKNATKLLYSYSSIYIHLQYVAVTDPIPGRWYKWIPVDTSGYQWHAIQAAGEGWKEGTTLLAGSAGGLGHLQAAAPKPEIMWEAVRAVRFPEPGCRIPWARSPVCGMPKHVNLNEKMMRRYENHWIGHGLAETRRLRRGTEILKTKISGPNVVTTGRVASIR